MIVDESASSIIHFSSYNLRIISFSIQYLMMTLASK